MKFKSLHKKAKLLDDLIDVYKETKGTSFVPMADLEKTVMEAFPDVVLVNYGFHKLVFHLRHKSHELALKIGRSQAIEFDHTVYKQLPANLRQVYFARVFWHTKYCLLQEYGVEAEATAEAVEQVRAVAGKYGILDITCDNIRSVNGNLKIVDATIAPPGLFKLWKTADVIKLRLPEPVRKAIRKSRMLMTAKGR